MQTCSHILRVPAAAIRCRRLAGAILAATFVAFTLNTLIASHDLNWTGAGYWLAALLLAVSGPVKRKGLSAVLFGAGAACLALAWSRGAPVDLQRVATANSQIIALLVAASLLPLLSALPAGQAHALPRGRRAIATLLLVSHLLGAVLNLSAVFVLGDRMACRARLDARQAIVLTRSFAAAGFWSPFFITMAVALQYAPGANLLVLLAAGAGMAAAALLLTYLEVSRMPAEDAFTGDVLNAEALRLPLLLVAALLLMHVLFPGYPALHAMALLTLLFVLALAVLRPRRTLPRLRSLVVERLPELSSEVILFIAAGLFSLGLAQLFSTLPQWQPFTRFGFVEATGCFAAIVLLAQVGIHPVASIAFLGAFIVDLHPPPLLAASVFLYGWALSSAISPLSSQNLSTFTRYDIDGAGIHLRNLRYGLVLSLLMIACFYVFSILPY